MKCTNKVISSCLILCLIASLTACAGKQTELKNAYDVYHNSDISNITAVSNDNAAYYGVNLCIGGTENVGTDTTDSQVAQGAGVFNTVTGTIPYAQNIYAKLYPASTTKILTAYLAIKYGNLDDMVTISSNAVDLDGDSSKCGLKAGDMMTLRDLLYGLMMRSGNDAAIAIAEHISGSTDSFAELMNEEAQHLGATGSHFVNPNGLPDENHYTTVYDLYLFFQAALANETFYEILSTTNYTTNYTLADGTAASVDWVSTNQYLANTEKAPDGFTIIGGKTGTTGEAGYCLVLLSKNASEQPIISIVLKADCKSNLYLLMNEILAGYGN